MLECMKPHWARFRVSLEEKNEDFILGHSYTNLFAEAMRCLGVPEKVIKFRIPLLNIGLPHILSFTPPFFVIYVWIFGAYLSSRKNK